MSDSWKVTLPCTRTEAEAIDTGGEIALDPVPTLMTTEEVLDDAEHWRLDAYFEDEPDAEAIAAIAALAPSAIIPPQVERLADADWVTMSQAGLTPIREGRFVVHTSAFPAQSPPGGRAFLIEAGQAFGTGHHATTSGCLAMLDRLAGEVIRYDNVVDLGTGTGLLAFAALELWPDAYVLATDIDPLAIKVTRRNMAMNGIEHIDLRVTDGARDITVTTGAEFDLIIANILAGPLVSMAPEIASIAAPSATIVLAGLLETQRETVVAAYEACGCALDTVDRRGDWSVLRLTAGAERFVADDPFDPKGRDGWALDI